jgi:hypothetical protein
MAEGVEMSRIARCIAHVVMPALMIGTNTFAATYQASVGASIQFVQGDTIAIGQEGTVIADFFDPIVLAGNAGFDAFAGVASFDADDQLLSIALGGPSGFANPYGRSAAGGSINTQPIVIRNLTSEELSIALRVDYFYSLSASAGDNETASSSIGLELLGREVGSPTSESLFRFTRALSQSGSAAAASFFDVFVTLGPEADIEVTLTAETAGEASAVPEPATLLTACTAFGVLIARASRRRAGQRHAPRCCPTSPA